MVVSIIMIALALTWLMYETNWMRVRLLVGKPNIALIKCCGALSNSCDNKPQYKNTNGVYACKYHKLLLEAFNWETRDTTKWCSIEQTAPVIEQQLARVAKQQADDRQTVEQTGRKWQFLKYGDDSFQLCQQCPIKYDKHCGFNKDIWFGWRIPARTVKLHGSTINFKEGCNIYRANLLKDIVKAQKSKALPTYPHAKYVAQYHKYNYEEESIELLVDGKPIVNINGNYKRGMIKDLMRQYCRPGEGKIRLVKVR